MNHIIRLATKNGWTSDRLEHFDCIFHGCPELEDKYECKNGCGISEEDMFCDAMEFLMEGCDIEYCYAEEARVIPYATKARELFREWK